ncbi:TonB-dependent receptor [Janthinobacterium sp. PC23-8]|uniref:TonB-dependent receptor n=1 Tax=Janthinobacterium sp. PC23-8 TaxID=2012679 RepID=UPI000B963FC8|nr:TonB-dependent receptor [Janthinobacterium sp. PC23-8]OYO28017.1 hypothetical protein CD932_23255 [Janthinobacterium sp. PC23-8]
MSIAPRRLTLLVSLALGSMVVTSRASAAEPDPAQAGTQSNAGANSSEITEVIVTAQKVQQPISKVPMSISAVTQAALEKQGVGSIADLSRIVPGLTVRQDSEPNVSIRGLASSVGAATTAIYIDDTPIQMHNVLAATASAFPRIFDLDRVEVLRGPQGTLFGAGSEGGTVRFITPTPSLTKRDGYARSEISTTAGGAPSYEAGVAYGAPIEEGKSGFRASLWRQRSGGYIDRADINSGAVTATDVNSVISTVARLAFLYKPMPQLTITPAILYQQTRRGDKDVYFEDAGVNRSYSKIAQPANDRFSLSSLTVQYDLENTSIKSVTSYFQRKQHRTDDYSYLEAAAYQGGHATVDGHPDYTAVERNTTPQNNLVQELRFSSINKPGDKLNWIGGLYYSHNKQSLHQTIVEPIGQITQAIAGTTAEQFFGVPNTGPFQWIEDEKFVQREVALFGELNYNLTPQLKLTAGLRVARNAFSFTDIQDGVEAGGLHRYGGSSSETPVTPKFGASYQLSQDHMVYATAAKGYRPGGANSAMAGNPACVNGAPGSVSLKSLGLQDAPGIYGSDSVWSYEVGDKVKLMDRRVTLSGSAYLIDWNKIQTGVFVSSCGLSYTTNLGKAVSKGFDLQLQARVLQSTTLSAAVGYGDAHYTADSRRPDGLLLAKNGDQLVNTPKWTVALGAQYDFQINEGTDGYARLDYQYSGRYRGSPSADVAGYDARLADGPSSSFVSSRVGVTRGPWEMTGFVNNLLNSQPRLNRMNDNVPGNDRLRNVTFRPRTVGANLTYRF